MKKLALIALSILSFQAFAEPVNYNMVSFTENVSTQVEKDLMTVTVMLRSEHTDRQQASNELTRRLNRVQAKLKQYSELTGELSHRSVYPIHHNDQKIRAWVDNVYLQVESKHFQILSKWLSEVQNDAIVQDMNFSVSKEKRNETINKLSQEVLSNFRQRAEMISQSLGFSQYKIVNIQIANQFHRSMPKSGAMLRTASAQTFDASTPEMLIPEQVGSEEFSQSIHATIQM